jgi:hypothetical protein
LNGSHACDSTGIEASTARHWDINPHPTPRIFCDTLYHRVKILYVSQYFPPEVGAPAARAAELAHHWSEAGHEVSVLTGFPNHPIGVVPPEWRTRLRRLTYQEKIGGVDVFRTWLCPCPTASRTNASVTTRRFFSPPQKSSLSPSRTHRSSLPKLDKTEY